MTPAEAAALLTVAAAFDNRKPDADQARAWAMALDGLRFEDCRAAIVAHYQGSRDWMMPSDVITKVKRIRNERVLAYGLLPDPPAHIDPDDTAALQRWTRDLTRSIADGELTTTTPNQPPALSASEASERMAHLRKQLVRRAPALDTPAPADVRAAIAATPRTWPKTETSNEETSQ